MRPSQDRDHLSHMIVTVTMDGTIALYLEELAQTMAQIKGRMVSLNLTRRLLRRMAGAVMAAVSRTEGVEVQPAASTRRRKAQVHHTITRSTRYMMDAALDRRQRTVI